MAFSVLEYGEGSQAHPLASVNSDCMWQCRAAEHQASGSPVPAFPHLGIPSVGDGKAARWEDGRKHPS